jgi:hypothetical protein
MTNVLDVYVAYVLISVMILRVSIGLLDGRNDWPFIISMVLSSTMMVIYGFYLVFVVYDHLIREQAMLMIRDPNNQVCD